MDEKEMRKMAEEMAKMPGMPKPMFLKVKFDKELQKITKKEEIPVVMGSGATFLHLLQNVFIEYPEIEKQYPPGVLSFSIDYVAPKPHTPLFDGDIIIFTHN